MSETETDTETSVWQSLMDSAYERQNGGVKKKDFVASLRGAEKAAVLLGNFNYQTENGGIAQWVSNGYVCDSDKLLGVLIDVGTESALELAKRIRRFTSVWVKSGLADLGCMGDYWDFDNDDEDRWETMQIVADEFDEFFYESSFHDRFMADVEAFLVGLVK